MNRASRLEEFIHVRGGRTTLGEILREGHSSISYKTTQAVSELREKLKVRNMTILCEEHRERPTDNEYRIVPIVPRFDSEGQGQLGIGL